jgi:hypothetical protein
MRTKTLTTSLKKEIKENTGGKRRARNGILTTVINKKQRITT